MKIRKLWAWGFMVLIGFLFAFTMPEPCEKFNDRVDNDVGFEQADKTNVSIEVNDFEICLNEAEVEISPGDNFNYVSSTTILNINDKKDEYVWNETLLGSSIRNNEDGQKSHNFDYSNNRFVKTYIESYNIPKTLSYSKDHYRIDRSRCVLFTEYIA